MPSPSLDNDKKKSSDEGLVSCDPVTLKEVQARILLKSQKRLESMGITSAEDQKQYINKFMALGNSLINDYLNAK